MTRPTNWLIVGLFRVCCLFGLAALNPLQSAVQISFAKDSIRFATGLSKIDLTDLKRHVSTLASDALEGREAGSRGGKAAAAYIRSELKALRVVRRIPRETSQEFGRDYQNLLLFLPGSDNRLMHEIIVVGAHYDHVGYGNSSNSQGPIGQIHNGADDNASGTAALLELIDAITSLEVPPARSILFAFWDAEEAGLLGSKHWVAHPTARIAELHLVLNLDMLGRLNADHVITVGWRSAPGLRALLASNNRSTDLELAFQPRVIADSDHFPFYAAGVPAIHLDTDKHHDYHRPSDDADKINWEGLRRMTEFAFRVVLDAANRPNLPPFRRAALTEPTPNWLTPHSPTEPPIRLGVTWDKDRALNNIIEVAQVNRDSPAALAGLRIGDRIRRLGSWENGSLDDLKTTIQLVQNPVPLRIERPGIRNPLEMNVDFWGTPVRLGAGWIDDPALPDCVVLTHVVADSPADRAGLSAGDVIMEMSGQTIPSAEDMRIRVTQEPGPFRFLVERQGRIRDVTVDLPKRPVGAVTTNESRADATAKP